MEKISLLKAADVGKDHRQWIIGSFMDDHPELRTDCAEVRWSIHPKGDKKTAPACDRERFTVTILVRGRFKQVFPEENKEIIQDKVGDMVYFAPGVMHSWVALEDSLMITIRTKSDCGKSH